MSRAVQLSLVMSRADPSIERMTAVRAIAICMIALFTTAVWGVIIHFGTLALGLQIETVWLTVVLAIIFFLLLLGLSMVVVASDHSDDDEPGPPPGA